MESNGIMNTGTDPEDLCDDLEMEIFIYLPIAIKGPWFWRDCNIRKFLKKKASLEAAKQLPGWWNCRSSLLVLTHDENSSTSPDAAAAAAEAAAATETQTTQNPFGMVKMWRSRRRARCSCDTNLMIFHLGWHLLRYLFVLTFPSAIPQI
jgi:hypothetical protein